MSKLRTPAAIRKLPADRKQQLLDAALKLSHVHGYANVTRHMIGERCGVNPSLVPHYFGTAPQLRRAILGEAIRTTDLRVIAQGIVARDKRALGVSDDIKRAAMMGAI